MFSLKQEISKKESKKFTFLSKPCPLFTSECHLWMESNRSESKNKFSLFYKPFLLLTELAYISVVFALHFFFLNIRIMYLKLELGLKRICILIIIVSSYFK